MNIAGGVSISWFLVMYLFGAYIRLHGVSNKKPGKWLAWGIGFSMMIPVSRVIIEGLLATPLGRLRFLDDLLWGYSVFYQYNSMLATVAALCLFVGFLGIKIRPGRGADFILLTGSASLGVYLIHDHYYIRESLWSSLSAWAWLQDWYLVPKIVVTVAAIYAVCTAVELTRRLLFRPLEQSRRLQAFFIKIDTKLEKIWRGESEWRIK